MAYTLQAIIAKRGILAELPGARLAALEQDYEMLPFSGAFLRERGIPLLPLTDEGAAQLPQSIQRTCAALSQKARLAYIEAEFFGGMSTQACALFEHGKMVQGPLLDDAAINAALVFLGVEKHSAHDEFDALGLGRHRNTDQWIA